MKAHTTLTARTIIFVALVLVVFAIAMSACSPSCDKSISSTDCCGMTGKGKSSCEVTR